jgi:hypothetical protein
MSIDKVSLAMAGPSSRLVPRVSAGGGRATSEIFRKSFGDPVPKIVDISRNPFLQALFAQQGVVERIRRKLSALSRKKGRIVPAKGIVASALNAGPETNFEDLVFVGVDFLEEYHPEEETIAGILAHEWGHLVSEFPNGLNPDELNWDQIFDLRKDEEGAADGYAGKMLFLMGYKPDGLVRFLNDPKNKKESLKYYSPETRAAIIRGAYSEAKRQKEQAERLILVPRPTYPNPFAARLIAVV